MPPKPSTSTPTPTPKTKSPLDEPAPPAFFEALKKYYEVKDIFDEEKVKHWASIPEEPPNTLPKEEVGQPWFDRVMEEQQKGFLPKEEEEGNPIRDIEERLEKVGIEGHEEAKEKEEVSKEKEGESKDKEVDPLDLQIDVDKLVAKWMGKEGLIVPPGLYQPPKEDP